MSSVQISHAAALSYAARLIDGDQSKAAIDLLDQLDTNAQNEVRCLQLRGIALAKLERYNDAIRILEQALVKEPESELVHNYLANLYKTVNERSRALSHFAEAIRINPDSFEAFNNRAIFYTEQHQWSLAEQDLAEALRIKPNDTKVLVNKGNAYFNQNKLKAALNDYLAAVAVDDQNAIAYYNIANVYQYLGDYEKSLHYLKKVYQLAPHPPFFLGMYLYNKLHLSEWSDLEQLSLELEGQLNQGARAARPFQIMALLDRPDLERQCAADYVSAKFPKLKRLPDLEPEKISSRKIRVGYFSSDFCEHPLAYLMTRVFESHSKEDFEIYAYAFNLARPDQFTNRVKGSVDHFINATNLSDLQLVQLARSHGLDIAVDLNGITKNCRTGIFAERIAPVQINYLGYLGSMGVGYYDYIIADTILIPPAERQHYTEKVIYLPIYQANDDAVPDQSLALTRSEFGLPESAFVFCSFNNNYKILPELFFCWIDILKSVPNSVLWLYVSNKMAKDHMRKTATEAGLDATRIVFATKVPLATHIARQALANLFLDTYPYNGGATTTAALRAGLPVLTLCGRSFSSRMGASLLTAVGLDSLIAKSKDQYRAIAVRLASNKPLYSELLAMLAANLKTTQLYNPQEFVANLEQGYLKVLQNQKLI